MLNLTAGDAGLLTVRRVELAEARRWCKPGEADVKSAIGHADTANVVASLLGIPVQVNRVNIELVPGDWLVLAQYSGPRLPEGTTTLPAGAEIRWYLISI